MTTIAFRSPVNRPLHPKEWVRPPTSYEFRVTQRFDDEDYYWSTTHPNLPKRYHRATDIGNGHCGEPIVAMAEGTAELLEDNATALGAATNALGVRVWHTPEVCTEYWHFSQRTVTGGQRVKTGQQIGVLGNTGLGAVCHTHIELKIGGVKADPEPHMFGAPLTVSLPDTALEVDVLGEKTTFVDRSFKVTSGAGNAIRSDTRIADDTLVFRTAGAVDLTVIGYATGDTWKNPKTGESSDLWWVYGAHRKGLYCIHSLVCEKVPEPVVDCQSAVDAALQPYLSRLEGIGTAADGITRAARTIKTLVSEA